MTQASPTVGGNLRHLRMALGFSLAEVAGEAGVSVATLSRIETDKQNLDVVLLAKLARVLRVVPADLFGDGAESDRMTVTGRLARMPAAERARAFMDASRAGDASLDDVMSMLDVLREEIARLQRKPPRRRKR
jgi:transcriptional regulator with XRE-family HTH domain